MKNCQVMLRCLFLRLNKGCIHPQQQFPWWSLLLNGMVMVSWQIIYHYMITNFYFYELKLIILRHYSIVEWNKKWKKERLILIVGLATICGHKPMTPIATNRRGIPSCVKDCIYMIWLLSRISTTWVIVSQTEGASLVQQLWFWVLEIFMSFRSLLSCHGASN